MSSTWAVRGVPGCAPLKSGTKAAGTSVVGCSAGTILIDQSGMAISYNDRLSVAELLTLVQRAFRTGSGAEPTHRRRRPDPERRPRRLGGSTQLAGRSPVTVASGKAIPPARYRNGSDGPPSAPESAHSVAFPARNPAGRARTRQHRRPKVQNRR